MHVPTSAGVNTGLKRFRPRILLVATGIDRGRLAVLERFSRWTGAEVTVWRYTTWWWKSCEASAVCVRDSERFGFKAPFRLLGDDAFFHLDPRVVSAIYSSRWDALIAYGYGSFTTLAAMLAAGAKRVPRILWSDARLEYERQRRWPWRAYKLLLHRLASSFIASGTSARQFLESTGVRANAITVVPYAIDNEYFLSQAAYWVPRRAEVRADLRLRQECMAVLFVGRMVMEKGVAELIRAARTAESHGADLALLLVGAGPDEQHFRSLATQLGLRNCRFIGGVPPSLLGRYYAASDVFVLPSHRDVWGKVVNEAALFSLPIVVTNDVGAGSDLVIDGRNGFRVKTRDVNDLAGTLLRLAGDRALRQNMGSESHELVRRWDLGLAVQRLAAAVQAAGVPLR